MTSEHVRLHRDVQQSWSAWALLSRFLCSGVTGTYLEVPKQWTYHAEQRTVKDTDAGCEASWFSLVTSMVTGSHSKCGSASSSYVF